MRVPVLSLALILVAACGPNLPGPPPPAQVASSAATDTSPPNPGDVLKWVDPFIGTEGDHGQLFPGAAMPFGLVKLSPETPGDAHAGYDFGVPQILGFSHTRLGGVGCRGSGGTLLVTPVIPGRSWLVLNKVGAEYAEPGYYWVRLSPGIIAEMTAGTRIGYHRYTYPPEQKRAEIRFDATHALGGEATAVIDTLDERTVTGEVRAPNVCDELGSMRHRLFFAMRVDGRDPQLDLSGGRKGRIRVLLDDDSSVTVRVALSPISEEVALAELNADPAAGDFDEARSEARQRWTEVLGRVRVLDDDTTKLRSKRLFYTGLYRSLLVPHNATASDGRFRPGTDSLGVRRLEPGKTHYSGWSTWDDYRKFPLVGLVMPEALGEIAESIVELHMAGAVPTWAEGVWPTPSVRNEMMVAVVLEALARGLIDPERVKEAYKALTARHLGNPLEQAYSHWVAMRLAERLGLEAEEEKHRQGAESYRSHWVAKQQDAEGTPRGFMTPKGREVPERKADRVDAYFYEGNLWHYRWWVPHDMAGLVELDGGPERFAENLDYYFSTDRHMALNEPPLAYPYLFVWAGKPWLTQKWSRHFTTDSVVQRYHNHGHLKRPYNRPVYMDVPAGWLPGMDDDTGTMSSQFVYQALGLYPACPGEPYYVIGSPIFERVDLTVGKGGTFTIEARNASDQNRYIQSATLNGKPLNRAWIWHREMWGGGSLVLEMGPEPNKSWAAGPDAAPPSMSDGSKIEN